MLWEHYVFRRGITVPALWDDLFSRRKDIRLLYITGAGFDLRAHEVLKVFVQNVKRLRRSISVAKLLLIGLQGYELEGELREQSQKNAENLQATFRELGTTTNILIKSSAAGEEDISASNALRSGVEAVLAHIKDETDIMLDVSSLPRVVYLGLITALLQKLVPTKSSSNGLVASGVNFQVLVAEDPLLDAKIRAEDPSNELIMIPGFSSALQAESMRDWPLVWFPILGENRVNQLEKVLSASMIPPSAEICPILPQPSRNPRRADQLLIEYKGPLFDTQRTPVTNILYAHEAHPFEAYRQILRAMLRYRDSLSMLGGCRLVLTPLGSKLITVGAGLACFEVRPGSMAENHSVAIPYSEPRRYIASLGELIPRHVQISALLLTGQAYESAQPSP